MKGFFEPVPALIVDTFRESFARKVFWGFWGCSTVVILFFVIAVHIDIVEGQLAMVKLFGVFGDQPPRDVQRILDAAFSSVSVLLFTVGLFLAIFAGAGLMPTVFEQGRIGLLLAKPVSRTQLLVGKYLGALLVVGANATYLVAGVWLVLGWKTEIWRWEFLVAVPLVIFAFAVMLTVVTYVAVLSRSVVLSTMAAYMVTIVAAVVGAEGFQLLFADDWSRQTVAALDFVLPKVFEIGRIGVRLMVGDPIPDWMPLWSSAIFGVAIMGLALRSFSRKDY